MKKGLPELATYVELKVSQISGNVFSISTKSMVYTRLNKRMLEIKCSNPYEYLAYLEENPKEIELLVGRLTTHHTFFFREYIHFNFIRNQLLQIIRDVKNEGRDTIKIWSSAASRGHEAISLALFFEHALKEINQEAIDYRIYATDIDADSIEYAKRGIYPYTEVKAIPMQYLGNHWVRGKGENSPLAKVKQYLFKKCHFEQANLLDLSKINEKFDIIFCRNVLIYFDRFTSEKVIGQLEERLNPNGMLITGVSEPVSGYSKNIMKSGPCVYRLKGKAQKQDEAFVAEVIEKRPLRVVNVDDSKSILKILNKIFEDSNDFTVVGQCENGEELAEFLKTNEVDVITLDLHMPVLDGVGYLKKYFDKHHPPVVVISSVNRDNLSVAKEAMAFGATDYVEKPNLQNFDVSVEEILNKVLIATDSKPKGIVKKEKKTQAKEKINQHIKQLNTHLFCGKGDAPSVAFILAELFKTGHLPSAIVVKGCQSQFQSELFQILSQKYEPVQLTRQFERLVFLTIGEYIGKMSKRLLNGDHTLCFFKTSKMIDSLPTKIIESNYILSEVKPKIGREKIHIMPFTSWAFHIEEFHIDHGFCRDTLLELPKLEGRATPIALNESVMVVYDNENKVIGIYIFSSISQIHHINFSKKISACKIIGKKFNCQLIHSFLVGKWQWRIKCTSLEENYQLRVHKNKVQFGRSPKKNSVVRPPNKFAAPIKVMVIDDSPTMAKALGKVIGQVQDFEICHIETSPRKVKEMIRAHAPDVITLDVNMPDISGVDLFDKVIKPLNIPVVLLSASASDSEDVTHLLSNGAYDFMSKANFSKDLSSFPIDKVIKEAYKKTNHIDPIRRVVHNHSFQDSLVIIGSSTGGTRALTTLFAEFPASFPPVLVAQHIPPGFSKSFATLLDRENPFSVKEAQQGEELQASTVYIAPGDSNMGIRRVGEKYKIVLENDIDKNGIDMPNVNHLFSSVAKYYHGSVVGCILTGMGRDGAQGIIELKAHKPESYTLAQDESSSVVFGMPNAALATGRIDKVLALNELTKNIFYHLIKLDKQKCTNKAS